MNCLTLNFSSKVIGLNNPFFLNYFTRFMFKFFSDGMKLRNVKGQANGSPKQRSNAVSYHTLFYNDIPYPYTIVWYFIALDSCNKDFVHNISNSGYLD